jgi:hypothetical protein
MWFQFKKKHATYTECELVLYYLNEEFPAACAVAEDSGRAGRSCRGSARESSLVVVVVTSRLRLALDEDPCITIGEVTFFFSSLQVAKFP